MLDVVYLESFLFRQNLKQIILNLVVNFYIVLLAIVSYKINKQHISIKIVKIADIRRRNHNRLCSFAKLNAKKPSKNDR